MASATELETELKQHFGEKLSSVSVHRNQVTIEVSPDNLIKLCTELRDNAAFKFDMLIDLCGIDYFSYGSAEWVTDDATHSGFSRGAERDSKTFTQLPKDAWPKPRFAVVYHLLSVALNHRLRVRCFTDTEPPRVPSVTEIWSAANWFEREAFDLYGILFEGHLDLRRILTDYGFVGHPFRKDFPLIGEVELRFDAAAGRCVYEPVSIEPRTLVPRVIREDNRFSHLDASEEKADG